MEKNLIPARSFKVGKEQCRNFAELEAKSKAYIPGPQYNTTIDWSKNKKGKWLKGQRLTSTDLIIKNKDKTTPAPG